MTGEPVPEGAPLARAELPLLEFDPSRAAMIEPSAVLCAPGRQASEMPERVVMCFFAEVVAKVAAEREARRVAELVSEHGRHTVWEIEHEGQRVGFFQPGTGAPVCAFFFEEVIAHGARAAVACGGAGALVPELALGHPVVVAEALRDEGTSYHYLAPSRTVAAEPAVVAAIEAVVAAAGGPFSVGRTWTTDAPYRETPARVAARREEGCITVEMEAAALLAVARWRGVRFGQILYAADALHGEEWDSRGWTSAAEVREHLFWLAVTASLAI